MPYKVQEILNSVKETLIKSNPDYDIAIKRLHLYYDMKLVTFGIDRDQNLIIQFPIFVQPYTLNSTYKEKNMQRFCFIIGGFSLRVMYL